MGVVLATVPKTGSHFMLRMIGGYLTPDDAVLERSVRERGNAVLYMHALPEFMGRLRSWVGRAPIVAPMRSPVSVRRSWKKLTPSFAIGFREAFEALFSLNPFILPIDTDRRYARLVDLSIHLMIPLRFDWTPVNENPSPAPDLSDAELAEALEVARHPALAGLGYEGARI